MKKNFIFIDRYYPVLHGLFGRIKSSTITRSVENAAKRKRDKKRVRPTTIVHFSSRSMKCFAPFEQMRSYQCFINTSIFRRSSRSFSSRSLNRSNSPDKPVSNCNSSSRRQRDLILPIFLSHEDCAMTFRSFATLRTIDL